MAKFLMELCQLEYSMLHYLPSEVAASSLHMAMSLNGKSTDELWVSPY